MSLIKYVLSQQSEALALTEHFEALVSQSRFVSVIELQPVQGETYLQCVIIELEDYVSDVRAVSPEVLESGNVIHIKEIPLADQETAFRVAQQFIADACDLIH